MKKICACMILSVATIQMWFADEIITKDITKLPAKGQGFIAQNHTDKQLSYIKIDKKHSHKEYDLVFTDGTEVEFDKDGDRKDITSKAAPFSVHVILQTIKVYLDQIYSNIAVDDLVNTRSGYDVEWVKDLFLRFDPSGSFMRVD